MEELKFEKDIPVPNRFTKWEKMEIGDSVYIEPVQKANTELQHLRDGIKARGLKWKITARKEGNGRRIWRVQ